MTVDDPYLPPAGAGAASGRAKNNPFTGAGYFMTGLGLITRKGLRRYVAAPLLINVAIFSVGIYYAWGQLGAIKGYLLGWLPEWLGWLTTLLVPLFVVTAALLVFFGFALVANLVAAPFNGLLSSAVEARLSGAQPDPGGWKRLLRELFVSVYSELRKLLYLLLWMLPLLLLFVIPVVQIAAPFVWALFGAWMLAVEYADFPMGNHGISFPRQRRVLAGRRYLAFGFGGSVMLALMVPLLNFLVIPAAVAGATAMWVEQLSGAETR